MTREERYKDQLRDILLENLAIGEDGKINSCMFISCQEDCIFYRPEVRGCFKKDKEEWLEREE